MSIHPINQEEHKTNFTVEVPTVDTSPELDQAYIQLISGLFESSDKCPGERIPSLGRRTCSFDRHQDIEYSVSISPSGEIVLKPIKDVVSKFFEEVASKFIENQVSDKEPFPCLDSTGRLEEWGGSFFPSPEDAKKPSSRPDSPSSLEEWGPFSLSQEDTNDLDLLRRLETLQIGHAKGKSLTDK